MYRTHTSLLSKLRSQTARAVFSAIAAWLFALSAVAPSAYAQPSIEQSPIVVADPGSADLQALGLIEAELPEVTPDAPMLSATAATSLALSTSSERRLLPENLGPNVNSKGTELGPVIAPDGRTLFFTRGGSDGDQDIWFSRVDSSGEWSSAERMPYPLTNRFNNFVESVTPDGNTLLIGGRYLGYSAIVTGLAMTHRTLTGWREPEPLRIRNYYSRSRSVSSCLGSDGQTIVMSLDREGGSGQQDLHVSFQREGDEWTEPLNLGAVVNSNEIDFAPFLAADGVTLYFSSKGHGGYGESDIFVTRRLDSTWRSWSTPENLGPTINSREWDAYYVIPASGEYVYFGSVSNSIGQSDLVRVPLPKQVRPQAVALMSGRVINSKTNEPMEATIRYETLPDGAEVGIARTDPSTGSYAIALPAGKEYAFRAEAPGFLGVGSSIDLKLLDTYAEKQQDLSMVPMEMGSVIALQNIFFDFAQHELRAESFPELDRLADLMKVYPALEIEIEGHTDFVGTFWANVKLSEARVGSVINFLAQRGIDPCRLHENRLGESRPIAPNNTNEGRKKNRRVEFRIVRQ